MKFNPVYCVLFSAILFSCSKETPAPTPDPTPESETVFLSSSSQVKPIETHEGVYTSVCDELKHKINGCSKHMPYSEFAKDSVNIYNNFVAEVQKLTEQYSGSYLYGTVTVGKSRKYYYPHYDAKDLNIKSVKNAYVLVPRIKGRNKSFLLRDLETEIKTLDEKKPMVTAENVDVIEPVVKTLLDHYKADLICGEIVLAQASFNGNDGNIEMLDKVWKLDNPSTLYELKTGESRYHVCYSNAYRDAVDGIEFDKPRAFKEESEAIAIADEVFKWLNGRFFSKNMSLVVSHDCFENYNTIKSLDIDMAEKVWCVEPVSTVDKGNVLSVLRKAIHELEEKGNVCYDKDYHPFKESIRAACKNASVTNDTLKIMESHTSVFYREPTVVDTLILR